MIWRMESWKAVSRTWRGWHWSFGTEFAGVFWCFRVVTCCNYFECFFMCTCLSSFGSVCNLFGCICVCTNFIFMMNTPWLPSRQALCLQLSFVPSDFISSGISFFDQFSVQLIEKTTLHVLMPHLAFAKEGGTLMCRLGYDPYELMDMLWIHMFSTFTLTFTARFCRNTLKHKTWVPYIAFQPTSIGSEQRSLTGWSSSLKGIKQYISRVDRS